MKYMILVLWTFSLFLLMFSSFPFRVECRPTRAMGPGPPLGVAGGVGVGRGTITTTTSASTSTSTMSSIFTGGRSNTNKNNIIINTSRNSNNNSSMPTALTLSMSSSSRSHRSSSSSTSKACPFLEGMFSPWPDLYKPDITMKVWETTLVLEGTARSRSEVKPDGTFGVTFDLHRIVKGEAPLLRRRKQFRLQFLDNPNSHNSNNNNNNVNVNLHSNLVHNSNSHRNSSISSPSWTNSHSKKNNNNNNRVLVQQQQQQQKQQQQQSRRNATLNSARNLNSNNNNNKSPNSRSMMTAVQVNKCAPPKAVVKTGRKYFVFAIKWENHFVAVFSPELANKKNTKLVDNVLCKECRQAPSVGATKEMVLKPKERIRIRCRLRAGNPVPVLTWYKDGKTVNLSDSRYRLRAKRRQSILVIRKTRESDIGEYKCEAKNYLGSAHAITRVVLSKQKAPLPPSRPSSVTNNNNNKNPSSSVSSSSKSVGTTPTTLWPLPSTTCPFDSYCLNGGTCSYYETIGEYVCQCAPGFKGQRCDTKSLESRSSPAAHDFESTRMLLLLWS